VGGHQLRIQGGKLDDATREARIRAIRGNWVKININDTHSKNIAIASTAPSPSISTRVDQHWVEIMDKKKRNAMEPLVCPIQDPSRRGSKSIRFCESHIAVLHRSVGPMRLCSRSSDPSEHLYQFCGPLSPPISLLSNSGRRVVISQFTT